MVLCDFALIIFVETKLKSLRSQTRWLPWPMTVLADCNYSENIDKDRLLWRIYKNRFVDWTVKYPEHLKIGQMIKLETSFTLI